MFRAKKETPKSIVVLQQRLLKHSELVVFLNNVR